MGVSELITMSLVEAEHIRKVYQSYDPMIKGVLDGDPHAITEAIKTIGAMEEFDRGIRKCGGEYKDHKDVINILVSVLAHRG